MPIPTLTWRTHLMASAIHAADLVRRRRPNLDPALVDVLDEPVAKLDAALQEDYTPVEPFWQRVLQAAADADAATPLADIALTKLLGHLESRSKVSRVASFLQLIRVEFQRFYPQHHDLLARTSQPIRKAWSTFGAGLLGQMVNWTDRDLLVESATVVVVPTFGGGVGRAFLSNNRVHLEVYETEPDAVLPEVLRLAWLLSQLNLDLPQFSERIEPGRRELAFQLAMIPIALKAGEILELTSKADKSALARAAERWVFPDDGGRWVSVLAEWWDVYETMRPSWPEALRALDHLLGEATGTSSQTI